MLFYKSSDQYYKEMTSTLKDVNVSKHDLIFNALMPPSYEFSYQSMMLDEYTKIPFAKSALDSKYYDYLEKRCDEMGVDRKLATYAIGTIKVAGRKNSTLPSGSIVSTQLGLTYVTQSDVTIDDSEVGYTLVKASEKGSRYNVDVGEINTLPVGREGILGITNEAKITNGYDDETYEALYERYSIKVRTPATSGNVYHYLNWALEVDGVGNAKVYPLWAGNGTVKVVIVNSNKRAASEDLIKATYDHIETVRPIGCTLTVKSATEKAINVAGNVKLALNYTIAQAQAAFTDLLLKHLNGIVFKDSYISIAKIGDLLINTPGVLDYDSLKINDSIKNIPLEDEEIPVYGTVNFGLIGGAANAS